MRPTESTSKPLLELPFATADSPGNENDFVFHMLSLAREYNRAVMGNLQAKPEYHMLRLSFERVLSTLVRGPQRAKDIAKELGVSKQHVSQLITEVEVAGLVEKLTDPLDSRARLVALTRLGSQLIKDGVQAATIVSIEFAKPIGASGMNSVLQQIRRLCNGLALPLRPNELPAQVRVETNIIGNELTRLADYSQSVLIDLSRAQGFTNMKSSDDQVLLNMGTEGARLGEIARINDMTTQGVGRIVRSLEQRGFVTRKTDPEDARGKILYLTAQGFELRATWSEGARQLAKKFMQIIGEQALTELTDSLGILYENLPTDIGWQQEPHHSTEPENTFDQRQLLQYVADRLNFSENMNSSSTSITPPQLEQDDLSRTLRLSLGENLANELNATIDKLNSHFNRTAGNN
ncbi:MAG: MarR family winged helix-turn-helix transcriptional regulator [Pseudomonadales bacterium]